MKRFEDRQWCDSMRLRVDYNNMMREFAGQHGISEDAFSARKAQYDAAACRMEEKRAR